jgi:hypothetical protein
MRPAVRDGMTKPGDGWRKKSRADGWCTGHSRPAEAEKESGSGQLHEEGL